MLSNDYVKVQNKHELTSVVVYHCFCHSKWLILSDLVGFALNVIACYRINM